MSSRKTKVPAPYTATQADPGGKPDAGQAFVNWVKNDISFKESQPAQDYTTGSGSGINNG